MLSTLNLVFAQKTNRFDHLESACPPEAGDLWTGSRWPVDIDTDFSAP